MRSFTGLFLPTNSARTPMIKMSTEDKKEFYVQLLTPWSLS
jgi:hypothetical protein